MPERESYLVQLSERIVPLIWQTPPPAITAPEHVFICVWELEAEVNNGGFTQYYFNSAGARALEAPAALAAIGASLTAEIVRAANALFPDGPPRDQTAREDALELLDDHAFEALDERFLAYEDDLSSLLFTYVQAHKSEIRGS